METSFKRSYAHTALLSAPNPAAGHHPPMPPLETPGHSQASLDQSLVGSSFLLGPCVHKVLFLPYKSLFPQSCVNSGGSMVGLMVKPSKRACAIPRSTALRALPLQQSTDDCYLDRRHSNTVLAQSLWSLWVCLAEASPLSLNVGYLFLVGSNIFLLMVVQQ